MKVRYPGFDFSDFRVHWARIPEFAQKYNALSSVPVYVEPYLVKVMVRVKKELPPGSERLAADIDVFIKQETQHYKQHGAFNRALHEAGYAGLKDIEQQYQADYERLLATRSLKFNLAYTEGFEALGSAGAENLFGPLRPLWEGAETDAVRMWRWHLAEEFEHRHVAFDAFKRLYCRGPLNAVFNGYFYRLYGYLYAMVHIGRHVQRCIAYLYETDRAAMSADERATSLAREAEVDALTKPVTMARIRKVFSPFYDPARKQVPPGLEDELRRYPDSRGPGA